MSDVVFGFNPDFMKSSAAAVGARQMPDLRTVRLVSAASSVRTNGLVWNIALAALYAVVNAQLAHGSQRFVIKSRDTERRAQFFIELAKILQMKGQCRYFQALVREQKFLVSGVPQPGELPFEHNGGQNRQLVAAVRGLAKFGAASIFFHAHNAARASDREA